MNIDEDDELSHSPRRQKSRMTGVKEEPQWMTGVDKEQWKTGVEEEQFGD